MVEDTTIRFLTTAVEGMTREINKLNRNLEQLNRIKEREIARQDYKEQLSE